MSFVEGSVTRLAGIRVGLPHFCSSERVLKAYEYPLEYFKKLPKSYR